MHMAHGVFVDGVWHSEWYDSSANGGRFRPSKGFNVCD